MTRPLHGVIAAIPTPIDDRREPDTARFLLLADELLKGGCDALNILGTTGEATSFSVSQRRAVMDAAAAALPLDRLMVGTGCAAMADTIELTCHAANLGFAGALLLPPFYYKQVSEDGMVDFVGRVIEASSAKPIPIYLYHFPALSGIAYTADLVQKLIDHFGARIAGLKDSSGNEAYARSIAALSPQLAVFPSNEANLRFTKEGGPFAGCISATINLNAADCAEAYRNGDEQALARATAIRGIFDGIPLVPGVKALVAHVRGDGSYANPLPPLSPLSAEESSLLLSRYRAIAEAAA